MVRKVGEVSELVLKKKKGKEIFATEIMIRILGFMKSAILDKFRWQKRRKDL